MSTLAERTARKYHGRMAETYETKRRKQARWDFENEMVERFLEGATGPVLDVPVGTGRFLKLYARMRVGSHGVDSSETMLALARRKGGATQLFVGDARKLKYGDEDFGTTVCVRFLDLIDETAMRQVVRELCRVTRHRLILTIRLGLRYAEKSNTCEHDAKKFRALMRSQGFAIEDVAVFRDAGWHVMRLERVR